MTSVRSMFFAVLLDLLAGFLVLILLMGGFLTGVVGENLQVNSLLLGSVFLAVGFIRGARSQTNPWIKGCTVASGLMLPVIGLSISGLAMTNIPAVAIMIAV